MLEKMPVVTSRGIPASVSWVQKTWAHNGHWVWVTMDRILPFHWSGSNNRMVLKQAYLWLRIRGEASSLHMGISHLSSIYLSGKCEFPNFFLCLWATKSPLELLPVLINPMLLHGQRKCHPQSQLFMQKDIQRPITCSFNVTARNKGLQGDQTRPVS